VVSNFPRPAQRTPREGRRSRLVVLSARTCAAGLLEAEGKGMLLLCRLLADGPHATRMDHREKVSEEFEKSKKGARRTREILQRLPFARSLPCDLPSCN
jgi:hypothetical protein